MRPTEPTIVDSFPEKVRNAVREFSRTFPAGAMDFFVINENAQSFREECRSGADHSIHPGAKW